MKITRTIQIDPFILLLVLAVITAQLLPCDGDVKTFFKIATQIFIAILFFFHGAKLSLQTVLKNLSYCKLHLTIFFITFMLFPLLGVSISSFLAGYADEFVCLGFLFLCALPSTVQSSIAFTSIAKGNVAAAICSASTSTLLGVFITPLLISALISQHSSIDIDFLSSVTSICLKLILPFALGLFARQFIASFVDKHAKKINKIDRTSILLVVYTAFSDAVIGGIWHKISVTSLILIFLISAALLCFVLIISTCIARLFKFNKSDEITIVFCGSKKSLASGIPIANVIFPPATVGIIVLPLMIFHQIQLIICAYLAARYQKKT